jgi:hypothetical protein
VEWRWRAMAGRDPATEGRRRCVPSREGTDEAGGMDRGWQLGLGSAPRPRRSRVGFGASPRALRKEDNKHWIGGFGRLRLDIVGIRGKSVLPSDWFESFGLGTKSKSHRVNTISIQNSQIL